MEEDKQNVTKGWLITGGIVIFCALANPFFIMLLSKTGFTVSEIDELGTVGDFFGGTTVGLLSLASILFVIHTITIQSKELALQRKELELTREEFKTGNTTAKVQQIDNAFFNMLSLHNQIVDNVKIRDGKETLTGREAIATLGETCKQNLSKYKEFLKQDPKYRTDWRNYSNVRESTLKEFLETENILNQEELDIVYKDFHDKYGNDIGHYMRNNYRIVKFIVDNVSNDKTEQDYILKTKKRDTIIGDRRYYFGMLRAQWSNAEFELILINSLYKENKKFKNLILKYDVLDIEETTDKNSTVFKLKNKQNLHKFNAFRDLIEIDKE